MSPRIKTKTQSASLIKNVPEVQWIIESFDILFSYIRRGRSIDSEVVDAERPTLLYSLCL